jgi:hypothetical protein
VRVIPLREVFFKALLVYRSQHTKVKSIANFILISKFWKAAHLRHPPLLSLPLPPLINQSHQSLLSIEQDQHKEVSEDLFFIYFTCKSQRIKISYSMRKYFIEHFLKFVFDQYRHFKVWI